MRTWSILLAILTPLAAMGAMGLDTVVWGSGPRETSSAAADELLGGATCPMWQGTFCGKAVTVCPTTLLFERVSKGGSEGKSSGRAWCGCVTNCTGTGFVKGIFPCGS